MKYKLELYQYLFDIMTEHMFDKDIYNNYSIHKNTHEGENLNNYTRIVTYEQIEHSTDYSDFISMNHSDSTFTIYNEQPDNIFLFDKKKITIMVTSYETEYNKSGTFSYGCANFHFTHNEDAQKDFINEAIDLFIMQKKAEIEKDTLLVAISKNAPSSNNNKKRI